MYNQMKRDLEDLKRMKKEDDELRRKVKKKMMNEQEENKKIKMKILWNEFRLNGQTCPFCL